MSNNLDISNLRSKARLNITDNIFSKQELKSLFIHNYNSKNGNSLSSSLNNNMLYQCFRNSPYYLLSRTQLQIWDKIDTLLTTDTTNFSSLNDDNKNLYIFIQTLIELMDDTIITNVSIGTRYETEIIEMKRTNFIDTRFDSLISISDNTKYNSLGILKSNYKF